MKSPGNSNQFRPTVAKIDLQALQDNLALTRELVGEKIGIFGVVKANAYGHGAVAVARTLEPGVQAFAVATPAEGVELREAGIRLPILLLGGPFSAPGDCLVEHRLTPVLYRSDQVDFLAKTTTSSLEVQLKIDTGMIRLGVMPEQAEALAKKILATKNLRLQGVLTHLAQADTDSSGPTERQYHRFEEIADKFRRLSPTTHCTHIALSAAILERRIGPCNWVRPGLMLYGASPNPRFEAAKKLKPVMSFETQIVMIKEIEAGTPVSYGGTWIAPRPSRIAVLAVGYADGYPRALSNAGAVLIQGQSAPVVGRVCMDLTLVDVTEIRDARVGDLATLWGCGLPVEEVAARAGTISYELLSTVGARVPRILAREG